jgi:hypothetical protein
MMKALVTLAVVSALVAFGPDCQPADPSGAQAASFAQLRRFEGPAPFPLGIFGWCVEMGKIKSQDIEYRVFKCKTGTVWTPIRVRTLDGFTPPPVEREARNRS